MTTKPATQLNTGDRIQHAGMVLKIVGQYNRKGYGSGVMPSPYNHALGTDGEILSFAQDVSTGGRHNISFARHAWPWDERGCAAAGAWGYQHNAVVGDLLTPIRKPDQLMVHTPR